AYVPGIILSLFGILVIGMIDNILRHILVGRDAKSPDWMILVSTLGRQTVVGLNGFVLGPLAAALFMSAWDLFLSALRLNQGRQSGQPAAQEYSNQRQEKHV